MAYPGTFLAVSHDRYFLDKVANCTYELANGQLTEYMGGYSYYLASKAAEAEEEAAAREAVSQVKAARSGQPKAVSPEKAEAPQKTAQPVADDAAQRDKAERGRIASMSESKRREAIDRAEAEIAMAEAELKGIEYEMNQPAVQADPEESARVAAEYAAKEREIEERYARWERLTEEG